MDGDKAMIAIGIGCRRGASQAAIAAMIGKALAQVQSLREPTRLCSIEAKRNEQGLLAAARALNLPLQFFSLEALRAVENKIATRSLQAEAMFGVASVSETAALAGAGADARLIAPRMTGDGVTCAIAQGSGR
jgi:cobalt-precorrin 5A hydrolase